MTMMRVVLISPKIPLHPHCVAVPAISIHPQGAVLENTLHLQAISVVALYVARTSSPFLLMILMRVLVMLVLTS